MHNDNEYICRVCGLVQNDITWECGVYPSHNICSCCGVEFGYEDSTINLIHNYRTEWIRNGTKWFNPSLKPQKWSYLKQLENIYDKYRMSSDD